MRLVFVGPPGSGKGTQAEWLVQYLSVPHLSTGDMLRSAIAAKTEIGRIAGTCLAAGKLVPDDVVIQIVQQRLQSDDCQSGALFDGFPRTLAQAEALDELLTHSGTPLDLALELKVPDGQLVDRLVSRGRADDKPEVIRRRLLVYHDQTEPLLDYYRQSGLLRTIDGAGTIAEVAERLKSTVEEYRTSRQQS